MKVKKHVRYSLVILAAGDDAEKENELLRLEADKPFRNIHVGDEGGGVARWVSGRDDREHTMAGMLLRVTKLRHVIAECDGLIDHLTVVFTEDIGPVRIGRSRSGRPIPRRPQAEAGGQSMKTSSGTPLRKSVPCGTKRATCGSRPARWEPRRGRGRAQAPRRVGPARTRAHPTRSA